MSLESFNEMNTIKIRAFLHKNLLKKKQKKHAFNNNFFLLK